MCSMIRYPRLGPMHAAALGLAALTSLAYIAAVLGHSPDEWIVDPGYPLLLLLASSTGLAQAVLLSSTYAAAYAATGLLHGLPALPLLPILSLLGSRRPRTLVFTAAAALGLWLAKEGLVELGVGVLVVAAGLSHMLARNTARGLSSSAILYLTAALLSPQAMIPVVLLYTLYLYVEEESRAYRPFVDRGLVVAGFATHFASMAAFMAHAQPTTAWMIIASASYFLAAGLLIPRPSS